MKHTSVMQEARLQHLVSLVLLTCMVVDGTDDSFAEELLLQRLMSGHVYSLFEFTTKWNVNVFSQSLPPHFRLFPKAFGQVIDKYGVGELHLTMTQGRWRFDKWGYPILSAPTGIELWVWFKSDLTPDRVSRNWKGLVHVLSGLFCSSLVSISSAVTISPEKSFRPLGLWSSRSPDSSTYLRYASLSRENVCTENLTPWRKLLPCAGKAGLSSLLNARYLFDSSYHSLGVHLRSVCTDATCVEASLELKQTLSSVFDPVHANMDRGWSLNTLFGEHIERKCPLAFVSKVMVVASESPDKLFPQPDYVTELLISNQKYRLATYDLAQRNFSANNFDISERFGGSASVVHVEAPYLLAHKHSVGYGEEYGGIVSVLANSHESQPIKVVYLDVMPYFVRVYLHTLRVECKGDPIKPDSMRFNPGRGRERPASLELTLTVPPKASVTVSIDYEKVFLDWTSHPPDSHHGFYIGSSVISALLADGRNTSGVHERCSYKTSPETCAKDPDILFKRIYTEPLLVVVPTPDFSMPYNVICLTCTVIAIAFGTLFNLSTRSFQVESDEKGKSFKDRLKEEFFRRFYRKSTAKAKTD